MQRRDHLLPAPRRRRVPRTALTALVLAGLLSACGDDGGGDDGGGDDSTFTIERALAEIPTPGDRSARIQVQYSDLDRATAAAGLERPAPDATDIDDLLPWLRALTSPIGEEDDASSAALLPSMALPSQQFQSHDEMVDELGFGVGQVRAFVEYLVPPEQFVVFASDAEASDLSAAMGEPVEGVWAIGPADGDISVADRTAARPVGESLRFAFDDGRIAASRTTPPIVDWLDSGGATLADDEDLVAVAASLDDAGVYAAILLGGDNSAGVPGPEFQLREFEAVGFGVATVDDEARIVIAYAHDDVDDAEANRAALEAILESGTSRQGRPYDEIVRPITVETDGPMLVATLELRDLPPSAIWAIVWGGETLVVHG